MPSNLVRSSAPGSCLTLVRPPPPPVHCTSCTLYTTEVIARNLSYPSSGGWRAMLPRYVTSGQFSSSVEFLNDLQKCILCVHNAEHILLSNSSYLMMNLLMDCVKPELDGMERS